MNERIKKLREQSLCAVPKISLERALLLTEFYKDGQAEKYSIPVARALAFSYLLQNKKICINEDELIVGERGPAAKETPTYPELCTHSLEDFHILDSRAKVSFKVDEKTNDLQKEKIIPFWKGRSIRDRIFSAVDEEWISAYKAGIFTEFMEQRAPGHTVLDGKIYNKGLLDFKRDIQTSLEDLDFLDDPEALAKSEELKAMNIAADALIGFAQRYAEAASELAKNENDQKRKLELEKISEICSHVPMYAPRNFWEALQHYWFIHLGVITELNTWDSFNPGRLDQHLYPFYKEDLGNGTLNEETA
ncbi:MAG: pyruvate formate lyase family protein, partial [Clostridiales bacterium]